MNLQEPRRPRLPTRHPATYRPRRASPGGASRLAEVVDVSESGLRLRVADDLTLGAEVELEIVVRGELLVACGRVVRVDPREGGGFEAGLRWTGIPTETLYTLLYASS